MSARDPRPPRAAVWSHDGGQAGRSFADLDAHAFPEFAPGSVWLVGAGPGAAGLLTLLAYHALKEADVLVHDALVGDDILRLARPGVRSIHAGKRGGKPSARQADITDTLIAEARTGARVLRLKGGDPLMFGRGAEEAEALCAAGIPFRFVPGISSGLGGLAYAGIPATHRNVNQAVTFLTGHDLSGDLPTSIDWPAIAGSAPVIVMYMAAKHLPAIAQKLIDAGRAADEPLAVVADATLPSQQVLKLTLGEATTPQALPTPAVIVVGKVVDYSACLSWFDAASAATFE